MTEMADKHRFKSVLEEKADEHLKLIGLVAVETTNLETALGTLLAAVIDAPERFGQVVYLTPKTSIARLETLENVGEYLLVRGSPAARELSAITGRAKALLGKRHKIIHGCWGITDGKVSVYELPGHEHDDPKIYKVDELRHIVHDIRSLIETVADTVKAFRIHHHMERQKAKEAGKDIGKKPTWRTD